MLYEEIHSPEEMAEFIVKTANKYNVKQITLCGGYRHTIIYNYDVMECNFMVEHDMTVVNEKGNKYDVNPKEYHIATGQNYFTDDINIDYYDDTLDWKGNRAIKIYDYV